MYVGKEHDACELLSNQTKAPFDDILIDVGLSDPFLEEQLTVDTISEAAKSCNQKVTLRKHPNYDHSYYFINTFVKDHIDFHAKRLNTAVGEVSEVELS